MSSISTDFSYGLDLDPKTAIALSRFARRRRWLLLLRALAAGAVFYFATMMLVAACDYLWILSDGVRWLLSLIGYTVTGGAMWWFGFRHFDHGDPCQVARQLESADPRLREDLLSAVELSDPAWANGSESFRKRLQRRVARRAGLVDIGRLLPIEMIQRWLMTGLVILVVCFGLLLIPRIQFGRRIARAMLPGIPIQRASLTELSILKPSPPSGFVAEGDAVGVTVQVTGSRVEDVWLQWRTEEGVEGDSIMSPRVVPAASLSDGTLGHQGVYSANLSVGSAPVEYRVIAGDAITLWNELKPLPRPRVESFLKRYEFPAYVQLDERVVEAEHGDLKVLVGTLAKVTVRFDEPVSDAKLRFGNRGVTFNLDPVNGSDRDFLVTIPIRTPAHYQIDATSVRSGLNNPFSPQYSVTPIIDTPPVVRWDSSIQRSMIVSPLDVISLAVNAVDDLPMERVVQEFQINNDPVLRRDVPVEQSLRELNLRWQWDLLHRVESETDSVKLSSGDIIRMRVVAIDRHSQRGETEFIELLIAEEGFDSDRHSRLEELRVSLSEIADWALRSRDLMNQMRKVSEARQLDEIAAAREAATELMAEQEPIAERLQQVIQVSRSLAEAAQLELVGRAMLDHRQEVDDWFATAGDVIGNDQAAWEKSRSNALRDLTNATKRLALEASRIDQFVRAAMGEELTVAMIRDVMSLHRSLRPLVDEQNPLPEERFPRYLAVAVGRLEAIGELALSHEDVLPNSTVRHLENWQRMSESWVSRLKDSVRQPPEAEAHRKLVLQFEGELRKQYEHALLDGQLSSALTNNLRDLRLQIGGSGDRIFEMDRFGVQADKSRERAGRENDSATVAGLNRDAQFSDSRYSRRDHLLERLREEESLHRSRPNVDLQYAADLKLVRRAIENVTAEGYAAYRNERAPLVHQKLARAFQVIEAKHEADLWQGELRSLLLAERDLAETAVAKIQHPTWIERFSAGLQWPVQTLRNVGQDRQVVDAMDRCRHSDDFNQARNRIVARRWSGDEMISAEVSLDVLARQLGETLVPLEVRVIEARETIRQYVLSLPEQAREAAEKAKQSKQETDSRDDSTSETTEQLDQQQQQAEDAARATLESLVDVANTADITSPEQRALARDADAASAQIQAATDRAEQAMENAQQAADEKSRSTSLDQAAEAMGDLAKALEQTADHFERAERGEDLAETREQLRQAEEALQWQDDLQEQYDRAASLAEAANSSPQELMERLERELSTNEPMQQELSEIAQRAAEAAQQTLQQAAKDERALNQSLENSDASFQERKRRAARQIANLARRASTVDQSLLQATDRAIGWANAPELRPDLQQAREQLRSAVDQANKMGGERALLSKIQQTAGDMVEAIESAVEKIDDVQRLAEQSQQDNLHKDDASRKRAKDQLERFAREARSQQLRAATSAKQQWAAAERDAGRRVQQAQRQKRDAENRRRQLEDRIKRDKNGADALRPELARIERQVQMAERAEQAAKASVELADEQQKQVEARSNELKKTKLEELKKPNPAAELASRMTDQASSELGDIRDDLRQLAEKSDFLDELRLPVTHSQSLTNQQARIENDVDQASEQLRRAVRHEERLGQPALAQQLDAAADAVTEQAAAAAAEATEMLQQASDQDEQTPDANRQVAEATKQIQNVADQLAGLLAATAPADQPPDAVSQQESGEQQRGEQLARTLDELDRAMAQSPKGTQEGQSQQQTGDQQAGQQQTGDQQAGQQQPGQPQNAAEASPTLADALNAQAQQAARQRSQQMNPSAQGQQQGADSNQTASSSQAATEPGSGEMPSGGFVETMGVERSGSEWGQLRERRTDDAAEGRSATIAPQYRREIEAYFRAIAERAAETQE